MVRSFKLAATIHYTCITSRGRFYCSNFQRRQICSNRRKLSHWQFKLLPLQKHWGTIKQARFVSLCGQNLVIEIHISTWQHSDILSAWLKSVKHQDTSLYVDVSSVDYSSIDHVFEPVCRPDLVLVRKSNVYVMELTVCHESDLLKPKLYKTNKYWDIKNHIKPEYAHFNIDLFTIEIYVLGFIADCRVFCESLGIGNMPKHVLSSIIRSALSSKS